MNTNDAFNIPAAFRDRLDALTNFFANQRFNAVRLTDRYVNNMRDALLVPQIRADDFTGGWVSEAEVNSAIEKADAEMKRLTEEYVAKIAQCIQAADAARAESDGRR